MILPVKNAFYAIVSPAGCGCTCVAKGVDYERCVADV